MNKETLSILCCILLAIGGMLIFYSKEMFHKAFKKHAHEKTTFMCSVGVLVSICSLIMLYVFCK